MKKLLAVALLSVLAQGAFGQSAIIRGENTPGVYETIKTDGAQHLAVSVVGAIGQASYTLTNPTVTNASSTILAANTSRKALIIQNNDTTGGIIYVNFTAAAVIAGGGVKILPGGNLVLTSGVPTNAITAIGSIASNANVVVVEGQ